MENETGTRQGPQIYLLSEKGYIEIKEMQKMLCFMAGVARGDAGKPEGSTTVTMSRDQLYHVLSYISEQIGGALDQLRHENGIGERHGVWQ